MSEQTTIKPVDLDDLAAESRSDFIEVQIGGVSRQIGFTWNPNNFTGKRQREVDRGADAAGVEGWHSRWLAYLLTGWGVQRGGVEVPISASAIDELPMQWQLEMIKKINEASRPNPTTEPGSSDGSGSDTQPQSLQSGSSPSGPQEPASPPPGD